MRSQPT